MHKIAEVFDYVNYVKSIIPSKIQQEGNFPKIINRAGWNKRAGRANLKP